MKSRLLRALAWAICLPLFAVTFPIIAAMAWWDDRRRTAINREFLERRGKRGILVYSNSPHWHGYIEEHWLPRIGNRMVVLNWSERSTWPSSDLAVRVFRQVAGSREFNPLAIVFLDLPPHATLRAWIQNIVALDLFGSLVPSARSVEIVRFWQPFRDFKHGKEASLRKAEDSMYRALTIEPS